MVWKEDERSPRIADSGSELSDGRFRAPDEEDVTDKEDEERTQYIHNFLGRSGLRPWDRPGGSKWESMGSQAKGGVWGGGAPQQVS